MQPFPIKIIKGHQSSVDIAKSQITWNLNATLRRETCKTTMDISQTEVSKLQTDSRTEEDIKIEVTSRTEEDTRIVEDIKHRTTTMAKPDITTVAMET